MSRRQGVVTRRWRIVTVVARDVEGAVLETRIYAQHSQGAALRRMARHCAVHRIDYHELAARGE